MKIQGSILVALAMLLGGSAMAAHPHKRARRVIRRNPEVRAKVKEKYDANDDGKLGPRERAKAHQDLNAKVKERREAAKARFDKDGDGKLSSEERKNAAAALKKFHHKKYFQAWKKKHPKLWAKALKKYDADGDGKLNESERKAFREACQDRREAIKDKFDKDGDGKLNSEERVALRKALARHRHKKHFLLWKKNHPKLWAKVLKKYDTDGDGKLAEGERKALVEAIKERRENRKEKFEDRKEKRKAVREKIKERRKAAAGEEDDADF
jgi:Ca2+-binding EF-hand superfamily protein